MGNLHRQPHRQQHYFDLDTNVIFDICQENIEELLV